MKNLILVSVFLIGGILGCGEQIEQMLPPPSDPKIENNQEVSEVKIELEDNEIYNLEDPNGELTNTELDYRSKIDLPEVDPKSDWNGLIEVILILDDNKSDRKFFRARATLGGNVFKEEDKFFILIGTHKIELLWKRNILPDLDQNSRKAIVGDLENIGKGRFRMIECRTFIWIDLNIKHKMGIAWYQE